MPISLNRQGLAFGALRLAEGGYDATSPWQAALPQDEQMLGRLSLGVNGAEDPAERYKFQIGVESDGQGVVYRSAVLHALAEACEQENVAVAQAANTLRISLDRAHGTLPPSATLSTEDVFQAHFKTNPKHLRRETIAGRAYLVAPATMIVAGVRKGDFVPSEELFLSLSTWDQKPLMLYHPRDANGELTSAQTEGVYDKQGIGFVAQPQWKGDRIIAQCYLDVEKCTALGGEARECLARLEKGEPIEGSIGFTYFRDDSTGEYEGTPFNGIVRSIEGDHYALLPHWVGACSLADECGLCSLEKPAAPCPSCAHRQADTPSATFLAFTRALGVEMGDLSQAETMEALRDSLRAALNLGETERVWTESSMVFDTYFVYAVMHDTAPRRLFRRSYTIDRESGVATLGNTVTEVRQRITFEPVTTPADGALVGGESMDRAARIAALMGEGPFHGVPRTYLEGLTDDQLEQLAGLAEPPPATEGTGDEQTGGEQTGPVGTPPQAAGLSRAELLQALGLDDATLAVLRDPAFLHSAHQLSSQESQRRTQLVQDLLTHPANTHTEEQLQAFDMGRLEDLHTFAFPGRPPQNFSGNGGGTVLSAHLQGRQIKDEDIFGRLMFEEPPVT